MRTPGDIFLVAGDPGRRGRGRDPLLAGILARLGKKRPAVAYVGAASRDDRAFYSWIAAGLKTAGAGRVALAGLASARAVPARSRAVLERADAVFISGGDVELGMRVLEDAGASSLLRRLHRGGMPFIGLSAGSIMLGESWVRWADPDDDATAAAFACLGLAPLCCDTHGEAEDWDELKSLLRLTGAAVGYGIPAGAALHVAAGGLAALGKPVHRLARGAAGPRRLPDLPVP